VSQYDPADALASCARFLQAHGWAPGIGREQKRCVIGSYNCSTSYVETVLALASLRPQGAGR